LEKKIWGNKKLKFFDGQFFFLLREKGRTKWHENLKMFKRVRLKNWKMLKKIDMKI